MIETTITTTPDPPAFGREGYQPDQPEFSPRSGESILIVDDEDQVRNLFAASLSDRYECSTAASANEALELLAAKSYDLVITDMMMPGRNGIELLRDVKSRYPDTAVIMVSGIDRPQRLRDALRIGASDYLIKPCELEVLAISCERALDRRNLQLTARKYKADLEKQNTELAIRTAELVRLQAQIVHSEKMASVGQLVAGIAHELNNPAGFIYGNMDLLKDRLTDVQDLLTAYDTVSLPANLAPLISAIKVRISYQDLTKDLDSMIADCLEGAVRIRDVVQNLRLFTRLDEAEVRLVDLHEGIDSTIRLLSRYYSAGRLELRRDYGDLPPVSCYASQLNQVWMNLLVNAAQAVSGDGTVTISTRREGDSVAVAISDSGCGIPPDQLSRIFDPFYTTKPVGEGTGLGLSISYGTIERHGGTITVESTVGSGSTFTVRISLKATYDSK
jgi:two-component system, NtrC family, sensor kinase